MRKKKFNIFQRPCWTFFLFFFCSFTIVVIGRRQFSTDRAAARSLILLSCHSDSQSNTNEAERRKRERRRRVIGNEAKEISQGNSFFLFFLFHRNTKLSSTVRNGEKLSKSSLRQSICLTLQQLNCFSVGQSTHIRALQKLQNNFEMKKFSVSDVAQFSVDTMKSHIFHFNLYVC